MRAASCLLAAALGIAASGCGSPHTASAAGVATAFSRAVTDDDGGTACALLAPRTRFNLEAAAGKPCAQAVLEEALSGAGTAVRDADVFGTAGRVRLPGDTVFLARFQSGWKVLAAGCEPRPPHPYDCAVQG